MIRQNVTMAVWHPIDIDGNPELPQWYLVTKRIKRNGEFRYFTIFDSWNGTKWGEVDILKDAEVIAWADRPLPYKE